MVYETNNPLHISWNLSILPISVGLFGECAYFMKVRDYYELSPSDTPIISNPTPIYDSGEKELTDQKLPTSDTSHVFSPTSELDHIEDKGFTDHKLTNSDTSYVFSPTPISEHGNIEDKEFTAHKPPNSDTPRMFSSTPISEPENKEDKEFTDHKLPTSGTPYVFIQSQESELDSTEDKDLTDYELPFSDTPHVFRPTPVSQLGSTGKKDLTESDPPSDTFSIITSDPVHKPDATQEFREPEIQSTDGQLFPTISGGANENSSAFRSTPVSNIDGQGQERFRGTYVKYMTKSDMPCSVTESLKHFPEENNTNVKAISAPRYAPSNLTLVTVEGCPTFLIVDWKKNENDTASEYEVLSKMTGPGNKTKEHVTFTNQTHAAVENLKPNTSYTFSVTSKNEIGRGPSTDPVSFVTESADLSVSEYVPGKDAIWTQYSFKYDSYSECQGKRFVKRTRYRKFVGIILCNSLRYKIYLSNSLSGVFYNIGDLSGHGEDHCQFVDSFLDGRTGEHLLPEQLPIRQGFYRSVRQEPVMFGTIGGQTHIHYVHWYECGIAIPGQW
ncbi:target of Nesh-SH3 [Heptranchias perlo]|uniref:target of Nesh-SH3 n=1 Tax=Heptranchias perlo TaxID=212740 RepID=UPI00355A1D67